MWSPVSIVAYPRASASCHKLGFLCYGEKALALAGRHLVLAGVVIIVVVVTHAATSIG